MKAPSCSRPVLLVEGDGDREAVPVLVRRIVQATGTYSINPASNPIRCGDLPKISRPGELEKFATYACRRSDGDSVLLVVDCEDDCPREVVESFEKRLTEIAERFQKKVATALMYREFESILLHDIPGLAQRYPELGWDLSRHRADQDWSALRGAKEYLSGLMSGYTYKPTRDQAAFTAAIELDRIRDQCRPVEHLFSTLNWLISIDSPSYVFPQATPEG